MTVVHLILTDAETDRCRRGLFGGLATFRFLKGGIPRAYPAWDLSILGMQGSGLPHSLPIFEGWASFLLVCTKVVYTGAMPASKHVRRSVSLPVQVARQVDRLAKSRRLSDNRVLVELIEEGIEAQKQKEKAFFELAERFRSSTDPAETKELGNELGRFVFGE